MYVMPTVFFAPTLQPDQQSPQCRQAYCITPATFGPGLWEIVIGGNCTERPDASASLRIPASLAKLSGPGTGATPSIVSARASPSSRSPSPTTASGQPALRNLPRSGRRVTPALISDPPPRPDATNTVRPLPTESSESPADSPSLARPASRRVLSRSLPV